jgi:glycosyltransferase involved in cell wall biosynthesis
MNDKLCRAIDSVADAGEVIVVDTSYGTPSEVYLPLCGRNVSYYTYPWRDNFAATRNFAIEKAKGLFIFSLDSDEWLDEEGRRILCAIGNTPPDRAFLSHLIDNGKYILDQVKIFPNRAGVRYIGRIHEQIVPSIINLGIPIVYTGINIYHDGYVEGKELQQKQDRNLRISHRWLVEEPANPWAQHWYRYIRGIEELAVPSL